LMTIESIDGERPTSLASLRVENPRAVWRASNFVNTKG
jgi:hypothetical protein